MTLATLATFRDPWEAHMFRNLLEAEGIPAEVADDQLIWMDWPLSTALGGVRVRVPDAFADDAQAVLERCVDGRYRAELSEMFGDLQDIACPSCGSKDFRRRPSLQQLLFGILSLVVATTIKVDANRYRCRKCGTRWREPVA
jgi:hypothetical protein